MTQSCAHWLNWQCGLALGAAREKLRVAHALEQLPLKALEAAMPDLPLPPEDCEPRIDVPAGASTLQRSHAPAIAPTARRADALARRADGLPLGDRGSAQPGFHVSAPGQRHYDIALWITSHRKDVLAHFEKPEFPVERDRSWISLPNAEPDHV
jgi:hypothetical protein